MNRENSLLSAKFDGDRKFARIFKSHEQSGIISNCIWFFDVLKVAKISIDNKVYQNEAILTNEVYFKGEVSPVLISSFEITGQKIDAAIIKNLTDLTADEYMTEYAM